MLAFSNKKSTIVLVSGIFCCCNFSILPWYYLKVAFTLKRHPKLRSTEGINVRPKSQNKNWWILAVISTLNDFCPYYRPRNYTVPVKKLRMNIPYINFAITDKNDNNYPLTNVVLQFTTDIDCVCMDHLKQFWFSFDCAYFLHIASAAATTLLTATTTAFAVTTTYPIGRNIRYHLKVTFSLKTTIITVC